MTNQLLTELLNLQMNLFWVHSHWHMEETTHVLLYTQLMDILLLSGVMWNQLFQSVSYLLSL